MKRIFIAIKVSKKIQESVWQWRNDFNDLPVRWIPRNNLHVTLIPPWQSDKIDEIKNKLEKVRGRTNGFKLKFSRITYGPNPKKPRLIWAEGRAPKEIIELKEYLEKIFNFKNNGRPFKLHLTLARFKTEHFSSFKLKTLNEKILWEDGVTGIDLIESVLGPEGAEYKTIKRIEI